MWFAAAVLLTSTSPATIVWVSPKAACSIVAASGRKTAVKPKGRFPLHWHERLKCSGARKERMIVIELPHSKRILYGPLVAFDVDRLSGAPIPGQIGGTEAYVPSALRGNGSGQIRAVLSGSSAAGGVASIAHAIPRAVRFDRTPPPVASMQYYNGPASRTGSPRVAGYATPRVWGSSNPTQANGMIRSGSPTSTWGYGRPSSSLPPQEPAPSFGLVSALDPASACVTWSPERKAALPLTAEQTLPDGTAVNCGRRGAGTVPELHVAIGAQTFRIPNDGNDYVISIGTVPIVLRLHDANTIFAKRNAANAKPPRPGSPP